VTTNVREFIELNNILVAQRMQELAFLTHARIEAGVESHFEYALPAVTLHQQGHAGRACAEAFFDYKTAS
jgi:hypothetical protein